MERKLEQAKRTNNFALTLILFGLLLIVSGLYTHSQFYFRFHLQNREKPQLEYSFDRNPKNLTIPSIGLASEVEQGGIFEGEWILSDNAVLYLPTSGKLGEGFNTVLYAHNTQKLFGGLQNIQVGDQIDATDNNGRKYSYKTVSKEEVSANNLSALYTAQKDVLTLFTCDGWADDKRLVVQARLISAK